MSVVVRSRDSSEKILLMPGYVVNIHDAINIDVDVFLPRDYRLQYRHVITHTYKYQEELEETIKIGQAYRCRLKGIQVSEYQRRHPHLSRAKMDLEKMVNRSNGWIVCRIHMADIYNRLLIDILDPITGENFVDLLFHHYPVIFTKYEPPTSPNS
jgi:hypothetical protein